jgi:hypothetical protein
MAERAGAHIVEVKSSHMAMITHPGETVDLIVQSCKSYRLSRLLPTARAPMLSSLRAWAPRLVTALVPL